MAPATILSAALSAALASPTLAGAHVGLYAVDTTGAQTVAAYHADDAFEPASTLKLIVGSLALESLGPDFAYTTSVATDGAIADGTLHGNLYLVGTGDAQLSRADLRAAAAAVAAQGIARIDGAIVGDETALRAPRYPPGWTIDDLPEGYAAIPSALSLDENVAHVRVAPGTATGAPARLLDPTISSAFTIENDAITGPAGSDDTTDVARPWDRPTTIAITGSYPLGTGPSDDLEPAVPDPARYAVDAFSRALASDGITATAARTGAAPAGARILWTHRSMALAQLLGAMWKPSDNLIAELLLESIGARDAGCITDARTCGIAAEQTWLARIGVAPSTVSLVDGSGLSAYDRITPRDLVAVLLHDWTGTHRETIANALPVAGVSGTLAARFAQAPLAGNLTAKTGSKRHVRALAGFVQNAAGHELAFAFTIDDWFDGDPHASQALIAAQAAILLSLLRG